MCGRFTSFLSPELLALTYKVPLQADLPPRYNIAPTQDVLVVREDASGARYLSAARWGLMPHWETDLAAGSKRINARSETVHEKSSFRQAVRNRRCIVPASGFYEWSATPAGKIPHYISLRDGSPLSFAGIWEQWRSPSGENLETCAFLTTAANSLMATIHERMPVILHPGDFQLWLDRSVVDPHALMPLYQPYPADLMQEWVVSSIVNSPRNQSQSCIAPIVS